MGIGPDLLRLLEPAVRPDGLAGPVRGPTNAPIETRDFASLLEEAGRAAATDQPAAGTEDGPDDVTPTATKDAQVGTTHTTPTTRVQASAIEQLAQVNRIENRALRGLIGEFPRGTNEQ